MAIYYARANGNVNGTIWSTTPSGTASDLFPSFTNADTLMSNGFTVTLNVNTTVLEIRNDTANGATSGGSFSFNNGVALNANIIAGITTCATLSSTVSATINGNITGGSAGSSYGVSMGSTGTLTIAGSITGGTTSTSAHGINISANGIINITGNLTGASSAASAAMNIASLSTVNIVGNITSAASGYGITINATCSCSITGNLIGNGQTVVGIFVGTGTLTVIGTATGSTTASPALLNNTASTVLLTRAKGGPTASSSVGLASSAAGLSSVEEIEYGDLGASPTSGPIRLVDKTSNVAVMYRFGASKKNLVDANASGLMPAASNVRFGISYNGGNSTGTCRVPSANSVAFGVLVDVASTGTAALTPASVWDYLTSNISTSNSIGERLKNCSTIASVGEQLANSLS